MTQDDIIRMVREAGMQGMLTDVVTTLDELARFAALVAKHEREACARVVEDTDIEQYTHCQVLHDDGRATLIAAANVIRARGEVQG